MARNGFRPAAGSPVVPMVPPSQLLAARARNGKRNAHRGRLSCRAPRAGALAARVTQTASVTRTRYRLALCRR
ncbi:hypothetical protein GCM10027093_26030 [Paraburkholderia jirisanensis]